MPRRSETPVGHRTLTEAQAWRIMQEANGCTNPRPLSEMIREAERHRGHGGGGSGMLSGCYDPIIPTPAGPIGPTGRVDDLEEGDNTPEVPPVGEGGGRV